MKTRPLASLELHDGIIYRMAIDYGRGTATIALSYYPDQTIRKRRRVLLTFEGVESISQVTNFQTLKVNAAAGNISYWEPSSKRGVTYLHLAGGTISITAKSLKVWPSK